MPRNLPPRNGRMRERNRVRISLEALGKKRRADALAGGHRIEGRETETRGRNRAVWVTVSGRKRTLKSSVIHRRSESHLFQRDEILRCAQAYLTDKYHFDHRRERGSNQGCAGMRSHFERPQLTRTTRKSNSGERFRVPIRFVSVAAPAAYANRLAECRWFACGFHCVTRSQRARWRTGAPRLRDGVPGSGVAGFA